MLDDRKLDVLRAIVEDYVSTKEPVGSQGRWWSGTTSGSRRRPSATTWPRSRSEGYITQPHTSAGRVPTDKGYRLFVDRLSTVKPLTPAERRAIEDVPGAARSTSTTSSTARVRLLAQLTRQVAVVQYPSLSRLLGAAPRDRAAVRDPR